MPSLENWGGRLKSLTASQLSPLTQSLNPTAHRNMKHTQKVQQLIVNQGHDKNIHTM